MGTYLSDYLPMLRCYHIAAVVLLLWLNKLSISPLSKVIWEEYISAPHSRE